MSRKPHFSRFVMCALVLVFLLGANDRVGLAASTSSLPKCSPMVNFEPDNFANSTNIDNQYDPLIPGTQYILDGTSNVDGAPSNHRVVFTVTDLNKVINGVTTRVIWDQDYQDGELAESELAFHAQDKAKNVWVLGEYPEEYDGGKFAGAPSTWINGIDRAKGGILVPGRPKLGSDAFLEGKDLSIDFWDCGQVSTLNATSTVPTGSYNHVLIVNEWAPLEDDSGIQLKYYAPGVGNVQIGDIGDPEGETLVLTQIANLDSKSLAAADREALKLDKHGRKVSEIYAQTGSIQYDQNSHHDDDSGS